MTIQRIPPDVRFWRHVEKQSNSVLAERYGVDISLISRIKSGKAWRNV